MFTHWKKSPFQAILHVYTSHYFCFEKKSWLQAKATRGYNNASLTDGRLHRKPHKHEATSLSVCLIRLCLFLVCAHMWRVFSRRSWTYPGLSHQLDVPVSSRITAKSSWQILSWIECCFVVKPFVLREQYPTKLRVCLIAKCLLSKVKPEEGDAFPFEPSFQPPVVIYMSAADVMKTPYISPQREEMLTRSISTGQAVAEPGPG